MLYQQWCSGTLSKLTFLVRQMKQLPGLPLCAPEETIPGLPLCAPDEIIPGLPDCQQRNGVIVIIGWCGGYNNAM
jgi:hypothetical protein